MKQRTTIVALLVGAAALLVGGCDSGERAGEAGGGGDSERWMRSSDPIDASGLVWAWESRVRLADGTRIDTETPIGRYVLAGDGVYFGSKDGLQFVTQEDEQFDTGLVPWAFEVSPDRRYLAVLDHPDGDGFITTKVYDLQRGRQIVDSREGMGSRGDDLRDLYEDSVPGVIGFSKTAVYVDTTDGILAFDLEDGSVSEPEVPEGISHTDTEWYRELERVEERGPWNESRTWRMWTGASFEYPPKLVDARGREVTLRVARPGAGEPSQLIEPDYDKVLLSRWIDDDTVLGSSLVTGGIDRDVEGFALFECEVSTRTCTVIDGTETGVRLPNSPVSPPTFDG